MAEGISTSLQTCPSVPQPYDAEEHPLDIWSFPSSLFPVNDLGLTPFPGSQLEQPTDGTQVSGDGSLEGLDFFFDPELALQSLEAALDPKKRTSDEAFSEQLNSTRSPRKKQVSELSTNKNIPSADETPSLSSPNSSHRHDQGGTVPVTPAEAERSQTPDSLFDSLDPLFEGIDFSVSDAETPLATASDRGGSKVAESSSAPEENTGGDFARTLPRPRDLSASKHRANTHEGISLSDLTKQRFSLNDQDVASNASREMLKQIPPKAQYLSPYPRYGGALGYVPSSPVIHVRYTEVAKNHTLERITNLQRTVRRLEYDREKYRKAWRDSSTLNPMSGKTKEQWLQEENASLMRISSRRQSDMESYKSQANEWRNCFFDLARTYNNLLANFQGRQMSTATPGEPCPQQQQAGLLFPRQQPLVRSEPPPGRVPLNPSVTVQNGSGIAAPAPISSQPIHTADNSAAPRPNSVTVDLTDENHEAPDSRCPPPPASGIALLQDFRKKKYDWLQRGNQGGRGASHETSINGRRDSPLVSHRSDNLTINLEDEIDDDELVREMEEELARG